MRHRFASCAGLLVAWLQAAPSHAQAAYDMAPVVQATQAMVDAHGLPGAGVYVNAAGQPVLRQFLGGYGANTRIAIASASKWLSAVAIARLVDRGQLDWDDTVGAFFPAAPAGTAGITLAQLMSHTSGLPADDAPCLSDTTGTTLAACSAQILAMPSIGTPGAVFAYGGNSMQVVGRMAEVATGKTWDQVFIDEVAIPLGLVATDWATGSLQPGYVRRPNPRIAGGVRSTLDDYARVVDMLVADGHAGGLPFLSHATLQAMSIDLAAGTTVLNVPPSVQPGWGYGIGHWLEAMPRNRRQGGAPWVTWSSPGAFGFTPWVDPQRGVGGVVMVRGENPVLREEILGIQALSKIQSLPLPTRALRVP